ncbi:hypothetical protein N9Y92_03740 [Chlamydiales bacterium]|nr:hypothetical protein [Chlamydiales bacterium]
MSKKKLTLIVTFVHLSLIAYLAYHTPLKKEAPLITKLAVSTVKLKPEILPPKITKKQESAPPKPTVVKSEKSKIDASQLKKARESLTQMEKEITPSPQMATLKVESTTFDEEGYVQDLIKRLQVQMHLPEFGAVTVQVTLEKGGQVTGFEIKETSSKINQSYVESTLPTISFPRFTKELKDENEHTFILVLNHK